MVNSITNPGRVFRNFPTPMRARADAQARTRARAHSSRIFATRLTGMVNSLPFSPASVVFRQVSIERMMHEQSKQRYSLLATSR
jgi:hypothetical protein